MKLTNNQISKIRELRTKGLKQMDIALNLGISQKSVSYWLSDDETRKEQSKEAYRKFKLKPLEERKVIYKKRLPYLKQWQKTKYKSDELFRKKRIQAVTEYRKKKKEKK